jgi:8-amino-7-oxononanoate synthase
MTPVFESRCQSALALRRTTNLYREAIDLSREGLLLNGGEWVNFSSNDYLGLSQEHSVISAWQDGLTQYGAGSGGSPLVTGHFPAHRNLIAQLTEWLGFEAALLFNSGFSANHAILSTLLQSEDTVFQDKLNHASLLDGGLHSAAKWRRFEHNDCHDLSHKLHKCGSLGKLVVTEGVFSMDGDRSPLFDMRSLTQRHDAWLMVDDAHGCGVLGEEGQGSCNAAEIQPDILVVTFGKAWGIQGAAILCSKTTESFLQQFARHWIYSTAMPPAQAVALTAALRCIQTQSWRREKLLDYGDQLQRAIPEITKTSTPIKPIMVGNAEKTLLLSEKLKNKGFWLTAIRPPTVPKDGGRLRLTLSAAHTQVQIQGLIRGLQEIFHV